MSIAMINTIGFWAATLIFVTGWMTCSVMKLKYKHSLEETKIFNNARPSTKEHDIDHHAGS